MLGPICVGLRFHGAPSSFAQCYVGPQMPIFNSPGHARLLLIPALQSLDAAEKQRATTLARRRKREACGAVRYADTMRKNREFL